MKITKQRLKEIIEEELKAVREGYESLPGGGLRWTGDSQRGAPLNAAETKKLFLGMARGLQTPLDRNEQTRAMMWIDKNWRQWATQSEAKEAIKQWLARGATTN